MYWGLKNVYLRFLVKKPRSRAKLKSDMALFRKPACRASSLDIREKISATANQICLKKMYRYNKEVSYQPVYIFVARHPHPDAAVSSIRPSVEELWLEYCSNVGAIELVAFCMRQSKRYSMKCVASSYRLDWSF